MNYYNEHDPQAAQWLRNLINAGLIPGGEVDERSIEDVRPVELRGFTQCHFFAGIGGWPLALALAGWPVDRPVWTGSCPCQPFSAAGRGDGFADERHLWPAWFHLIRECRPVVVFGEQVASAIGHGWLDLVSADLEAEDYAIGCAVLGAHSVGAPHIRQRLYWVADAMQSGRPERRAGTGIGQTAGSGIVGSVADASGARLEGRQRVLGGGDERATRAGGVVGGLAEPNGAGLQSGEWNDSPAGHRDTATAARSDDRHGSAGTDHSFWSTLDWLRCRDGKWRPVESGSFPLAHGVPGRVVRLRAYGNAIVPQTAAAFIRAFVESGENVRAAA